MNTNNETPEAPEATTTPENDLHEALSLSILAILRMQFSAWKRMDATQNAEVKRRMADGTCKMALSVTSDGVNVEASLALIDAKAEAFSQHLIKLHGPILTAITPPEAVSTVNLLKLN